VYVSIRAARDIVLRRMYEEVYNNDDAGDFTLTDIKRLCVNEFSLSYLRKVIELLAARALIKSTDDGGGNSYTITPSGISAAERVIAKGDEVAWQISSVPAADRLVSIDHNSQTTELAISAVEDAEEAIRASNSLPEAEKAWLREHLSSGVRLMKGAKITLTAIKALLLSPLYAAYKHTAEEGLRGVLAKALDLVIRWLSP
jgi:predicted transcriptional regulator